MGLLFKRLSVPPNQQGLLYRKNRFRRSLSAGVYYMLDPLRWNTLYLLPTAAQWTEVRNQEVLAKDNVAFRFSYAIQFSIIDSQRFIAHASPNPAYPAILASQATQLMVLHSQVALRDRISSLDSSEINEKRGDLLMGCLDQINMLVSDAGLKADRLLLKDLTFPKRIQDLFSLTLEAKLRAQSDLENARTAVASARALKNAAQMLREEPQVQFLQLLETMSKIASSGKHTFVIGDPRAITNG